MALASLASAQSTVHNVYGNAYDSGGSPLTGVTVKAFIDGVERGSVTTVNYGAGYESFYTIDINGDASEIGKTIAFTIEGQNAVETDTFTTGNTNIDLNQAGTTTTTTVTTTILTTSTSTTTTSTTTPATTTSTTTTAPGTTTTAAGTTTTVDSTTTINTTTTVDTTTTIAATTSIETTPTGRRSVKRVLSMVVEGRCTNEDVSVSVYDQDNDPARGVEVKFFMEKIFGRDLLEKKNTGRNGEASFNPTSEGDYSIEADKSKYRRAEAEITIIDCGPPEGHCSDGIRNYGESGLDCGGDCDECASCYDRIINQGEEGVDCGGPCQPCASCSDGVRNQGEEGVDCGGPCHPCPPATCVDGIINQGEVGVDCGGPCGVCGASCFDGVRNRDEDLTDCGGKFCNPCSSCYDNIINQGEEGVDCGGPCPPCPPGSCVDKIRNQNEEGVDCGGVCKNTCPSCLDGIINQGEEGVDCGGPCPPCPPATCVDGIINQGEVGVDCGGPCGECAQAESNQLTGLLIGLRGMGGRGFMNLLLLLILLVLIYDTRLRRQTMLVREPSFTQGSAQPAAEKTSWPMTQPASGQKLQTGSVAPEFSGLKPSDGLIRPKSNPAAKKAGKPRKTKGGGKK